MPRESPTLEAFMIQPSSYSQCAANSDSAALLALLEDSEDVPKTKVMFAWPDPWAACRCANQVKPLWIGILNDLFYGRSYSAGPGELYDFVSTP